MIISSSSSSSNNDNNNNNSKNNHNNNNNNNNNNNINNSSSSSSSSHNINNNNNDNGGAGPGGEALVAPGLGGTKMCTANLRTKILDFEGFYSSTILMLRGGILMSIVSFLERLNQQILIGIILVGRGTYCTRPRRSRNVR